MDQSIDRHTVVSRHNPVIRELDPFGCLSVGNGEFIFTVDVTGLQTFEGHYYEHGIPLETKAHWAWHSFPNPNNYTLEDVMEPWQTAHGRTILYGSGMENPDAHNWLRADPHRFPLGKLAFKLDREDGGIIQPDEVRKIHQTLDLWTGLVDSRFEIAGKPVHVQTLCHPTRDMVTVQVESPLVTSGQLKVVLDFPYVHDHDIKNTPPVIWDQPERHTTQEMTHSANRVDFQRKLDTTTYYTSLAWSEGASLDKADRHTYVLSSGESGALEFRCQFSSDPIRDALPGFGETARASAEQWQHFWNRGAMIDLGESTDERAGELERRTILSLYLTRIQMAGSVPPEETGLTCNSWHGKHNVEVVVMHLAHFASWNRIDLLEKGLAWYLTIIPEARRRAQQQGFGGLRWPKMTGFAGDESPGPQVVMIWQQPNPVYLAELSYRAHPDQATLQRYKDLVLESVQYMADFAAWDPDRECYVLGPPLWAAHEVYSDLAHNQNSTFELAYWAWGLATGQQWLKRLGLPANEQWDHVLKHLSPLPVQNGLYPTLESDPYVWEDAEMRRDMPTMLKAYEMFSCQNVDVDTMRHTLSEVMRIWGWDKKIWGSDYPSIAITAARLGESEIAVNILTADLPSNRYLANGHCYQREDLPAFLPSNTTFLLAVGMMAGGWDGAPEMPAPGFPKDGKWKVRCEGFARMP